MKKIILLNTILVLLFSGCASESISGTSNIVKIPKVRKGNVYIVQEGDTLSQIAKEYGVSVDYLKKINMLENSNSLKVGDKIYLKHKKKRIKVIATAYTSHRGQTDKTPFLAAWNNRIRPGMKIIAVSPDLIKKYGLKNGQKVKIKELGSYYIVRDKMSSKFKNRVDIYMGLNKHKAIKWGKRKVTLVWD